MIASIDEALRRLDAIEPARFYINQSRNFGNFRGAPEWWYVHDSKHAGECTSGKTLTEAVEAMESWVVQRVAN